VADDLNRRGLATLLFDLLGEREAADRAKVFDIVLLADRCCTRSAGSTARASWRRLPLGLFGGQHRARRRPWRRRPDSGPGGGGGLARGRPTCRGRPERT